MNKLKTLICIPRYWPAVGGSELHTRELAHYLSSYAEITVLNHNSCSSLPNEQACATAKSQIIHDQQIPVHQVAPTSWRRPLLKTLSLFHPKIRLVRPIYDLFFSSVSYKALTQLSTGKDLIHVIYNGMTCVAEQALKVAKQHNIPFVFTPLAHTHTEEGKGWSSSRFLQIYRQADAIIAMTHYEREWLIQRGAHPTKTHVCPVGPLLSNNPDPEHFKKKYNIEQAPSILFLGRHVETKGYQQLAEAAHQVWHKFPETRFIFMGPQTDKSKLFFNSINDSRLLLIPNASDKEKCSALAACDLLCVPSTQESLGVIYLEAWHYAKPVIAANIEVMQTVIHDGQDGLLIPPDTNSIANAITKLLSNPELRLKLGESGQSRVQQHFSWTQLAKKMAQIYCTTLNTHAAIKVYC
ncbi:glycosyltransferase family 4 protein [Zooshikella ganghwensis]|uniref:glycosyltransferase family 4 protein n=1 Tax=Zooshikella ganghwensis TaxID=202772 RepID=UPI000419959F|nr:glycosyltransferase family 4 protein [Zooshikella ganghwensis]